MKKAATIKTQIKYLRVKDEKLAELFDLFEKLEKDNKEINLLDNLPVKETIYEDLLSSIISQQISVKAAQSIEKKFLDLFKKENNKNVNLWPNYAELLNTKDGALKSAGLSSQKISYVKNVATYFKENNSHGHDFDSMNDQDIIKKLVTIKGVGQWTAEMMLMFTLGRQDIFSICDGGLVNGVVKLYKLEKYRPKSGDKLEMKNKDFENKILKITERWSPYRTLASRYIWRYKDLKSVK